MTKKQESNELSAPEPVSTANTGTVANTSGSTFGTTPATTWPSVSTQVYPAPVAAEPPKRKKAKKTEKCPECGGMFTKQGIDSHRRLAHGVSKNKDDKKSTDVKEQADVEFKTEEGVKPEGIVMSEKEEKSTIITEPIDRKLAIKPKSREELEPELEEDLEELDESEYDDDYYDDYEDEDERKEEAGSFIGLAVLALILGGAAFVIWKYVLNRNKPETPPAQTGFIEGQGEPQSQIVRPEDWVPEMGHVLPEPPREPVEVSSMSSGLNPAVTELPRPKAPIMLGK